ncbi:MAG TPA: GGDEF domain-containing protein [Solirubrobacterales bacterium]|nr:GGDEF domain-containing protein [Solirubrobacterales bacterium]
MTGPDSDNSPARVPVGPGLLVAGLAVIVVGLLGPLAFGSFSHTQRMLLALAEALCLVVIAVGVVVMARRLQASHRALWELARRDALTGVGNYRSLHERLAEEIARHGRHGRQFALILLDLDGFKAVNELYGHLEGDRLLTEVGGALRDEVRDEDAVFRQGGDEFAVIVEEADAEEATEVAARIRARIVSRGFGNDEARPLSGSTGFAVFPADGTSAEALVGYADTDLASNRGRGPRLALD